MDNLPPDTSPMLPVVEDLPPIPRGKAQLTIAGAIMDVLTAVSRLEAVAIAAARALDEVTP